MQLWELVSLVSERYGRRLSEHKKKSPNANAFARLSVQQFQYLQAISRMSAPSVGSLASYFNVRSPTATSIINHLENGGLIEKIADARDRRRFTIMVTDRGAELLGVQTKAFRALAEDIAAALTPTELKTYTSLTAKICESLK